MEDENTANGSSPKIFASLEPIIEESLLEDTWKNSMPNYMAVAPSTPISIIPTTTEDWDAFFAAPPPPSPKRLRISNDILASMDGSFEGEIALSSDNLKQNIIHIYPGQDIVEKIMSFCKEGHRVATVLSADAEATVSSATLRGPASEVALEGRFEILSLTGRFVASECESAGNGGAGGRLHLTVSMVLQDAKVIGGTVVGPLMAATRMHVVIGTLDPVPYKPKAEINLNITPPSSSSSS
ncbi:AT-hook motif nuclear-localized protein 2-like [Cucurbita maxima]|uniref:AT-hook motif nuclear-localized protein n=1 Tax=Cucurbita maxima TaxID=3661 RepID=A0A6J1IHZ3_CUCMA|nr:AT-hook motif nuclear-localized protein 2-like [Cucurbita maxima]